MKLTHEDILKIREELIRHEDHFNPTASDKFTMVHDWLFLRDGISLQTAYMYGFIRRSIGKNGFCWPSINTIAKKTKMSRSTVKRHLNILVDMGLLRKTHRNHNKDAQQRTTLYSLRKHPMMYDDSIIEYDCAETDRVPSPPVNPRIEEVKYRKDKETETVHPTYERTEQIGGKEQTAQPVCSVPSKERRTAKSLSTDKSKAKARSVQILKNHGVDFEHLNAGLDAGASPMAQMVSLYCEKSGASNGIAHLFRIRPEKLNEVLCFLDDFIRECAGDPDNPDNPVDYFYYALASDYNGKVPETLHQVALFARRIKEGKTEKDGKIYGICPDTGRILSEKQEVSHGMAYGTTV